MSSEFDRARRKQDSAHAARQAAATLAPAQADALRDLIPNHRGASVTRLAAPLAAADPGMRARVMTRLQQTCGNACAQRVADQAQRAPAPDDHAAPESAGASLFETERARPEDAEDMVGLVTPTAGTHDEVVALRTQYGAAAPHRTLAYGFTAWSPRRTATFPNVNIAWQAAGNKWIAVVQPTRAAIGVITARYVKPDTYAVPGATRRASYPQCQPPGKRVPLFSKVSPAMAQLAKTAEQEHCDDYQRAFNLSLKRCADAINAIAGRRLGPGTRPNIEQRILRQIGGKTPRQWVQELNRLSRRSLQRDDGAHRLNPGGDPRTCPADCSKIICTTVRSPTTRIPGTSSEELIR